MIAPYTERLPSVGEAISKAGEHGFVVYPSARGVIKDEIRKALEVGTIELEDVAVSASALVAGGIKAAIERRGSGRVTVADVRKGWRAYLSIGPPNHPPHRCLRHSVVERVETLKGESEFFARFLREASREEDAITAAATLVTIED